MRARFGLRIRESVVIWAVLLAAGFVAPAFGAAVGRAPGHVPGELVVKLHTDGAYAVEECAERLHRAGRSLRSASAADSDSLDRLADRFHVRSVRAVFRRPDARSFRAQRAALRQRLARAQRYPRPAANRATTLPDLSHVYLLRVAPGTDVTAAAAAYGRDPHVEYAQPNHLAETNHVPNDPFFHTSGSFGQAYPDLWGLHAIDAASAWDESLGEGVVVAVVDSGLDYEHPDIADNVWVHPGEDLNGNGRVDPSDWNGVDDDGNGFVDDLRGYDFVNSADTDDDGADDVIDADPYDDRGHGTHVAGTIAAVGDNGIGILGVAPRARVMALKGLDENGSGSTLDLSRAIVYAAENGADVINNSWSCSRRCPSNPVAEDAARLAHGLGAVVVFSAGNKTDDVVYFSPENRPETLVVGASTEIDGLASFSNFGYLMDVVAPGGESGPHRNILSLRAAASVRAIDGDGAFVVADDYVILRGTSMAAPHVAGLAALIRARRPHFGPDEIAAAVRDTALDLGAPGRDRKTGAGRIDAGRALAVERVASLGARIDSPGPGFVASQREGALTVLGTAAGDDFASYEVSVGRGLSPANFATLPPAGTGPVDGGALATWDVSAAGNGPYLLRLAVTAVDGSVREAFAPGSLERIEPVRVSSPGEDATAPVVSRRRVVWQSRRPREGDGDEDDEAPDFDLFLTNLRNASERRVVGGPGDQTDADLDGRRLAWRRDATNSESAPTSLDSCVLRGPEGLCAGVSSLAKGDALAGPSVSGRRVLWSDAASESGSGSGDLYLCEAPRRPGHCRTMRVVSGVAPGRRPRIDGDRLLWHQRVGGTVGLQTCELERSGERGRGAPTDLACEPNVVDSSGAFQFGGSVSRDRIAWESFAGIESDVRVCEFESETGACPSVAIRTRSSTPSPEVSRDIVVWQGRARPNFDHDIFFCQHDSVDGTCPPQRLTGSMAGERAPDVSGRWVVWEDERDGTPAIFGYELPWLRKIADHSVTEGGRVAIALRCRGEGLVLSVERSGGGSLEGLGIDIVDRGNGVGKLAISPEPGQAGLHRLTVSAVSADDLVVRSSFALEVLTSEGAGPSDQAAESDSR